MKKKKIIIILVILLICLSLKFTTLARYSTNKIWNYYLKSHGFYISSDNLGIDEKNINTFWDGNSVHFNIKNSINQSLISEYDIRYTVTCEILDDINATCKLNGKNDSEINGVLSSNSKCKNNKQDNVDVSNLNKTECEIEGYEWQNQITLQDLYFDIVPNDDTEITNVNVLITLNTTSPYTKTMTGIFNLYKNEQDLGSITKQVNDYIEYDELIITNSYDINRCVDISFDSSKRIVDIPEEATNIISDNDGYINKFKISVESKKNKKIIFYNKDLNNNYNIDDFIIEESGC